jgi:hypothetical protein
MLSIAVTAASSLMTENEVAECGDDEDGGGDNEDDGSEGDTGDDDGTDSSEECGDGDDTEIGRLGKRPRLLD